MVRKAQKAINLPLQAVSWQTGLEKSAVARLPHTVLLGRSRQVQ